MASALYDVLNDIIVDARITKYRISDRKLAKQHIESIHDKLKNNKSIITFDRGYPSYDMFDYLDSKELLFLMRVSTSFKLAESLDSEDSILEYKINGKLKKVRVIKVELSNGITETLNNLIEKAIKIRSQVKSNRSCERKNKHPRKKHHHNIKSCI